MKDKLTAHHFLYPVLIMAGLTLAVFWVRAEIANARADERSIAHAEKEKDLQAQRDANAVQAKQAVAALEVERLKPATVQTVTKYVPAPMPQGSQLAVVTPGINCVQDGTCVDSKPFLELKGDVQQNLQWIQDMEIKHAECDTKLSACAADKVLAASQLKEMTADRDNWKDTAKGGSKWQRLKKGLKVVGCAGAGAGIGSLLAKSKGAAIGGAAGAATCSIF